jgi:hypothetical protein
VLEYLLVTEPKADEFFASRSGVCVYVNIDGQAVRVQFASVDAHGIAESSSPNAEAAIVAAKTALQKHRAELAPLFERVARGMT